MRVPLGLALVLVLAGCAAPVVEPIETYQAPRQDQFVWIEAEPLPYPVADSACTKFEGAAWMFGGASSGRLAISTVARYDGEWHRMASLQHPVFDAVAVPVTDRIHVLGGYERIDKVSDRVQEYIVANNLFNPFPPSPNLPQPLAEAFTFTWQGKPTVAGGTHDGFFAAAGTLTWQPGITAGWMESDQTLTNARASGGGTVTEDGLIVAGGWSRTPDRPETVVEVVDIDSGVTSTWEPMPTPRTEAAAVAWKDRLFVIGGNDPTGQASAQVEFLDVDDEFWWEVQSLPEPLAGACALVMDDGLHVLGGRDEVGHATTSHWLLQEF